MKRKLLVDDRAGTNSLARQQSANEALAPYSQFDSAANGAPPSSQDNPLLSIWRRRWSVLAVMLCCGALAIVYLHFATKYYTSTAELYVEPAKTVTVVGTTPTDSQGGDPFLWRQASMIQSETVRMEAAKRILGLDATDAELHGYAGMMLGMMSIDIGRKDEIITISYDAKTSTQAAQGATAIMDAYMEHVRSKRTDSKTEQLAAFRTEKAKYDAIVTQQRKALLAFRKGSPSIELQDKTGNTASSNDVAQLSAAVTTARLATIDANTNLAIAESAKDSPARLMHVIESLKGIAVPTALAQLQVVQKQLTDAELGLELLHNRYPAAHPSVVSQTMFVNELRTRYSGMLQKFADEVIGGLQQDLDQATTRQNEIEKQLDVARRALMDANDSAGQLELMNQDLTNTNKIVDSLDSRIKDLELSIDVDMPNVTIYTTPRPQDSPSKPASTRILALMLAVGMVLGSGFAIVLDKLDGRLRSAEEIAAVLGLPVIGAIPHMKRGLTSLARSQAAHWDPLSEVAEAYRAVRTAIHFGVPADGARTVVVTSPAPGDGKSTLASNLAITMAQAGKRTLLLDADFRRPVQHKMFEVKEDSGLTSVLAGSESLTDAIHRTLVEGLDLLPAGPMPLNPSELLNGDAFAGILEELTERYDHIVLDGPPVMAVTDSRILGAVCDVTIMVLRAGKTTRKSAELARSSLLSVGARLIGIAVNDVAKGEPQYGYYGDYSYQPVDNDRRRVVDEAQSSRRSNGKSHQRLPSPVQH